MRKELMLGLTLLFRNTHALIGLSNRKRTSLTLEERNAIDRFVNTDSSESSSDLSWHRPYNGHRGYRLYG